MSKTSLLNPFKAIKFLFQKPKTLQYPFELKEPASRYRGFHTNDWEKCTGCGNCADICPNEAIEMVKISELVAKPDEGIKDERPKLDYGRCCFCGLCVDICPPGSLSLTRDYFHIHFNTDTFTFIPKNEKVDQENFVSDDDYSVLKASLNHRKENYQGFAPKLEYALFEPDRIEMPQIPPEKRKLSFIEQVLGYNKNQAIEEASRCLECGLCEEACPAHLKISDYIDAIAENKPEKSLNKIYEDNPIPSICGRVCMKYCEDACSLKVQGDSLAIRWLKRYAADTIKNYKEALEIQPGKPTCKKIAIIGAGPSGLSLAYFLRLQGHGVIVFDELSGGGGALRTGPPTYRLPLESIDKDVNYIESLGVQFQFNTRVGEDIEFEKLLENYDSVFLGIGNTVSFSTGVKNSDRCQQALDFLKDNKVGEQRKVGEEVIVIGGGNVAMDVARESIRLQHMQHPKEKVKTKTVCLECWDEIPATEEEITEAKEEGIQFNPTWGPKEVVLDKNGNIKGLECKKVDSVFDENGRFSPTYNEDKTKFIKGDMIIEAIGQRPDFSFLGKYEKELEITKRKKVAIDENGMTSIPNVFAGGDIVNTNLDAVTAIADAKLAAEGINEYLSD